MSDEVDQPGQPSDEQHDAQPEVVDKPPTQRAYVFIPAVVFFVFDTVLLIASGRPIGSAVLLAAASAVLVGWILRRRFDSVRQRYERRVLTQEVARSAGRPATPSATDSPSPVAPGAVAPGAAAPGSVRPPVGSWSNPSGGQKLRDRWDRAMPFARRYRRPGERHRK